MNSDELVIRPLRETDSLEALTELLHRSYRVLADMGLRYYATHQSPDQTRERIGEGICFVAECDGEIVGTVLYRKPSLPHGIPFYERHEVAHVSQLAVKPEWQRQGVGRRLMQHVEETARNDHARELALDTAEEATHLIAWYRCMGYRFIEYVDWEVTNYRSVVLSKAL